MNTISSKSSLSSWGLQNCFVLGWLKLQLLTSMRRNYLPVHGLHKLHSGMWSPHHTRDQLGRSWSLMLLWGGENIWTALCTLIFSIFVGRCAFLLQTSPALHCFQPASCIISLSNSKKFLRCHPTLLRGTDSWLVKSEEKFPLGFGWMAYTAASSSFAEDVHCRDTYISIVGPYNLQAQLFKLPYDLKYHCSRLVAATSLSEKIPHWYFESYRQSTKQKIEQWRESRHNYVPSGPVPNSCPRFQWRRLAARGCRGVVR